MMGGSELSGALTNRLVLRCLFPLLVIQFSFAVDTCTDHGDSHSSPVEQIDGNVEKKNADQDCEALLEVAAYRHCESASQFVRVERRDVEEESEEAIAR